MNNSIKCFLARLLGASCFFISSHVLAESPETIQWDAVIDVLPKEGVAGGWAAAEMPDAMTELKMAMSRQGVTANLVDGKLKLTGQESLDQLRGVLFDDETEQINFLGGPVEMSLMLPVGNPAIRLELEASPTTGYRWEVISMPSSRYIQQEEAAFQTRYPGAGSPAIQTIDLQSEGTGDGVVHLIYRRPFENEAPIRTRVNLRVSKTSPGGLIELTDPTPVEVDLETTSQPDSHNVPQAEPVLRTLPTNYDARTLGIIPSIRDQGSCGSCWAFGTVGVMETAIIKGGGPSNTDLSEQFLVSCNKDGWSCNGGLTASKYHYNVIAYQQSLAGAVLESDKPYLQTNGSCDTAYPHLYKASGWQFLTGSEWTMPTNDQIKNAIINYGAVTAGVCVDNGWYTYTGGVYSSASNVCGGYTNHQIVLVGWDEATQSWLLRNSWGTNWGENGYMRIKYDPNGQTSRVGEGASWISYTGGTSIPTIPSSVNASDGTYPDRVRITWGAVTGATKYEVYRATSTTGTKSLLDSPTSATFDDTGAAVGTTYYYWVKACNSAGCSNFSSYNSGYRASPTIPTIPGSINASDGTYTDRVRITWGAVTGATKYVVYRATSTTGTKSLLGSPASATFDDTGGAVGNTYYYWVKACNSAGCSNFSSHNSGYRASATIPTIPSSVNASDGTYTDRVRITWGAVTRATKYEVYRATSTTGTKSLLGSPISATHDDTSAVVGTTYYYWVKACNSAGCSNFSSYNSGYRRSVALPDLIVTSVTGPMQGVRGQRIYVQWQVKNQGPVKAGPNYSRIYFSVDGVIKTSDIPFATCYHSTGIYAGAAQTCSRYITVPTTLAPGTYYFGAMADYAGSIPEANESNNVRSASNVIIIK